MIALDTMRNQHTAIKARRNILARTLNGSQLLTNIMWNSPQLTLKCDDKKQNSTDRAEVISWAHLQ